MPFIRAPELYITVPDAVTALAPVPAEPLFVQLVIVQPDVVQFVQLSDLSQRSGLATHPGLMTRFADTTEFEAKAELLAGTLSPELLIVPVNVTVDPLAARVGVTGTLRVSLARDAMVVVLVHVTVAPLCAPQDHPLSENDVPGPVILAGILSTVV